MNDYYDVSIKEYRLNKIKEEEVKKTTNKWSFYYGNISDKKLIDKIFDEYRPDIVVNLAAQAGVRYSISNPDAYIESNLIGFYNILEACRHSYDDGNKGVEHLVYASSSSVYGSNKKVPYSTDDKVDNPVSLYAATKKSNELMAHAYSKLYNIPSTGLRFFTVYGPAGRPDMAYFGFTNKLRNNETIKIFNYGNCNCKRDFTYIDDIVEGVSRVMKKAPERKTGEDGLPVPPYAVYNIGNSHPENLLEFVDILQQELISAGVLPEDYDFEAHKELVPTQPGDVPVTYADTSALERDFGFKPSTSLRDGLREFARWYKEFYWGEYMKWNLSKGIKFLKNKDYRFDILSNYGFYDFMDDREYLYKKYYSIMDRKLDLDNPKTFNEKLQWLKLNDRNIKYIDMVDKYEAKKYVASLIGEEYIIPTLEVYDKFDDIDFNKLPNQFVIKCTHDSGGIVIVKNKENFNIKDAKKKMNKCLKRNYYYFGREWPYKNVKPRIIVEKFMEDKIQKEILDYKFFCFDGKVEYMYISAGSHSKNQRLQYFNKDFEPVDCKRSDYHIFDILPKKPKGYNKMLELAEKLSSNIKHVRVDFYEINEQIYFSEFTFYTGSGFIPFEDEYWDRKLGNLIKL